MCQGLYRCSSRSCHTLLAGSGEAVPAMPIARIGSEGIQTARKQSRCQLSRVYLVVGSWRHSQIYHRDIHNPHSTPRHPPARVVSTRHKPPCHARLAIYSPVCSQRARAAFCAAFERCAGSTRLARAAPPIEPLTACSASTATLSSSSPVNRCIMPNASSLTSFGPCFAIVALHTLSTVQCSGRLPCTLCTTTTSDRMAR